MARGRRSGQSLKGCLIEAVGVLFFLGLALLALKIWSAWATVELQDMFQNMGSAYTSQTTAATTVTTEETTEETTEIVPSETAQSEETQESINIIGTDEL